MNIRGVNPIISSCLKATTLAQVKFGNLCNAPENRGVNVEKILIEGENQLIAAYIKLYQEAVLPIGAGVVKMLGVLPKQIKGQEVVVSSFQELHQVIESTKNVLNPLKILGSADQKPAEEQKQTIHSLVEALNKFNVQVKQTSYKLRRTISKISKKTYKDYVEYGSKLASRADDLRYRFNRELSKYGPYCGYKSVWGDNILKIFENNLEGL